MSGTDLFPNSNNMRRAAAREALRTLHPGYFALVMATGIVSIGIHGHGPTFLSTVLLWLTGVCYLLLVVLLGWRIAVFGRELRDDLTDPRRAFGFFTMVAGSDVLGTRLALEGYSLAAVGLLAVGVSAWLVLGYLVPWTAVLGRSRRPLIADANGTWFIWVVASQSVAVLAAALQPTVTTGQRELALLAVFSWSVGVFLYAAQGIFVAARLLTYPLRPADLSPPYWIAMGATAITVLAGTRITTMVDTPVVVATRGLIAGSSVVFWAFGTWLIPVLVAAGWWRHITNRVPLRYEPTWWSVVFPLGMYGAASQYLGQTNQVPIIRVVGDIEIWVAFAAWTLTAVVMLIHLVRTLLWQPAALPSQGD